MHMKRLLIIGILTLGLTACVDTTGISPESSKTPKGNPSSVVQIAEYADLECPACRAAHTTVVQPILAKYGNQIRYDFHFFPLRSIHRYTMDLSEAAECVADQGKFWEYVDSAFEKQPDLAKGSAAEWGSALVTDQDLFSRCTRSHIKAKAIMAEYDQGIAMGVQGTPTFFVNGKQVQTTVDDLSAAIDAQLKGAKQRL